MALARTVSASQAGNYYYESDPLTSPEGKGENSDWYGELQNDLSLNGRIGASEFQSLLAGTDTKTGKILVKQGVNNERRAGIDLAFSAPKSVSIVALHLGDENVIKAHKEAVIKALDYVEENLIEYRERDNITNKIIHIKSDNMIAATFIHSTSRANDPQLHTHSVILNITKTKDDKYKAISNEAIFKNQKLINSIYQNELALNIQKLGYSIDNYDNKFEISGISEEAIETFSKRSNEIDKKYELLLKKYPDLTEAEVRDIAVLSSRDSKTYDLTKEELKTKWEEEYSSKKIIPNKEIDKKIINNNTLIQNAIKEITKTESTFNKQQLLHILINQNKGIHTLNEFKKIIENAVKNTDIIYLGEKDDIEHYSTKEMIRIENDIIFTAQKGKNSINALMSFEKVNTLNNDTTLTSGQREFIKHILTSKDRINIIQGDAGTGKTYAVNRLREIIEAKGLNTSIIGLGFTGKAAQELSSAARIETSTIASFIQSDKELKNSIIIVDEASMVSSKDMLNIIDKSKDNRIVFVGDGKQLQAIGAGKMFKELQNEKVVKVINMEEVLRQKTEDTKQIVTDIKNYADGTDEKGIFKAFEILKSNNRIIELQSRSKSFEVTDMFVKQSAVDEYLRLDDCILLTSKRSDKDKLNEMAREKFITPEQRSKSQLVRIKESITANQYMASSYKKNDRILHNKREYKVTDIDIKNNLIKLEHNKSKSIHKLSINPMNEDISGYRESVKEFTAGDKIIFTKNDKAIGVVNGLSGVVEKIDKQGNLYIQTNNKRIIFNLSNYSYLDYGYAQTLHKAQGQTAKNAILVHSEKDNISTASFYVAASRVSESFKVITPDIDKLYNSVKKEQDKSSTREFKDNMFISSLK